MARYCRARARIRLSIMCVIVGPMIVGPAPVRSNSESCVKPGFPETFLCEYVGVWDVHASVDSCLMQLPDTGFVDQVIDVRGIMSSAGGPK